MTTLYRKGFLLFFGITFGVFAAAPSTHAALVGINFINCGGGGCPLATTLFAIVNVSKTNYTPGEQVLLSAWVSSDDNPQYNSGVSPILLGRIDAGTASADFFPLTYSPQQMRDGISALNNVIGNAPSTGDHVIHFYFSSSGYRPYDSRLTGNGGIPFTVTTGGTVQVNFQP